MRRAGQLFHLIVDRDNLRLAYHKALRGKRHRFEARAFGEHLDANLAAMADALLAGTVAVGEYRQFVIRDPKERVITAPCFRERVLHHAIMNVCEPHFERGLIDDTFACRKGKGRLKALDRARRFARRHGWFLKLDVRKYFDSVPHETLLAMLGRRFKDGRLLALLGRIVRSFRGPLGRGLPIGSLTSQHLANFYLGAFDRFVQERPRVCGYVRYMDDVAIWSDDRAELKRARSEGEAFLRDELGLEWKPWPYLNQSRHGLDFLGCRVFPTHMVLGRQARRRYRQRLRALEAACARGSIAEGQLQRRATALTAFTTAAGISSWKFRQAVVSSRSACGHRARTGLSGAAAGTTTARTAGRRTATGTRRRTGTTTWASGSS